MIRTVLIYAAVLAGGGFALAWLDYKRLTRDFAAEFYIVLVALGFAALGAWAGARLVARATPAPFAVNAAAMRSLGVTPREMTVLQRLAAGRSNKQIARELGVSPHTVKTHVSNLYAKLGAQRRTAAVDAARRLSLLP